MPHEDSSTPKQVTSIENEHSELIQPEEGRRIVDIFSIHSDHGSGLHLNSI